MQIIFKRRVDFKARLITSPYMILCISVMWAGGLGGAARDMISIQRIRTTAHMKKIVK